MDDYVFFISHITIIVLSVISFVATSVAVWSNNKDLFFNKKTCIKKESLKLN